MTTVLTAKRVFGRTLTGPWLSKTTGGTRTSLILTPIAVLRDKTQPVWNHSINTSNNNKLLLAAAAATLGGLGLSHLNLSNTTACEDTTAISPSSSSTYQAAPNPLWPAGIDAADVEALVADCLADPNFNISAIPDYLESQIYRSTIQLTLNALYQTLGGLHGNLVWGHELRLVKVGNGVNGDKRHWLSSSKSTEDNDAILDQVVEKLLANQAVNQPLIPDVVERQVYKNCLRLIFRLLHVLSSTLQIQCCGHVLGISIEPSTSKVGTVALHNAALRQATRIDPDHVRQWYEQHAQPLDEQVDINRSLFQRWFRPVQHELLVQLHATLYALILGMLDDVLQHTELRILSDTVVLDWVAVPPEELAARQQQQQQQQQSAVVESSEPPPEPSAALPLATFTAGLGMGLTLMALLKRE